MINVLGKTPVLMALSLSLTAGGCLLRADLKPRAGEQRVVLWDGVVLAGKGGAAVRLEPNTVVKVAARDGGDCAVEVPGKASLRGTVDCTRLGLVIVAPTAVLKGPGGDLRFTVNGGVMVAPKAEKGDFVEVGGEATRRFRGWVARSSLGVALQKEWLAPMPSRFPWACHDGAYFYDRPKGKYRYWLPGAWCRVKVVEEQAEWLRVEYVDYKMKVSGWVEASDLEPDPEPRFHEGAQSLKVKTPSPLYAKPGSPAPFGTIDAGTAVWASTTSRGRRLVQARLQRGDVVGWIESSALGN